MLALYKARKSIKIKKKKKIFKNKFTKLIFKNFEFSLTNDQKRVLVEIDNDDLKSANRMFSFCKETWALVRLLFALISAANVIEANFQVSLMAPTEILALQHYELAKRMFSSTKIKIELLTGKTETKEKRFYKI